jgi:aryl-alcohol dehydrogenase-like predicted oxidoreductase
MSYGSSAWRPWVLDEELARPFIRRAIELGFNFFDTADMYSAGASEQVLGRALRDFGPGRDRIVIHQSLHADEQRPEPQGAFAQAHHALNR